MARRDLLPADFPEDHTTPHAVLAIKVVFKAAFWTNHTKFYIFLMSGSLILRRTGLGLIKSIFHQKQVPV
jgi:hypothetical protein